MMDQIKGRILRIGAARLLTRGVTEGDHFEINPQLRWEMPPE